LTGIIHPAVRREIQAQVRLLKRKGRARSVVLDVPLLLEARSNAYRWDALVVVSAPLSTAAKRLKRRCGWTLAEVKRRARAQRPLREKEKMADFVVRNGGSRRATRAQVSRIWKQMNGKWRAK